MAIVLGPLLILGAVEVALHLAGFGHSMAFFLPMRSDGRDYMVENDRFGWRFFGPEMARAPFPFAIPKDKSPDTIRVFVFGESAAYGDPQPEFGLCRILQALLEGRYPDKHFEVINTGMTAINSHVILPIAEDCAKRNGDFWAIYMGNNEVVGPYGAGTVFGKQAASLSLVRTDIALKTTRIGQALGDLGRRAQKRPLNQSEWGGMMMFVHNHVRENDPRMDTVYASFEHNLNDIIDTGLHSGAKVVVSTIARNLKDCAPFASDHRANLSNQDLTTWDGLYQKAVNAQQSGRSAEAIEYFRQAAKIDDSFAEMHFRWGQCSETLGDDAEAARQFGLACDQDTLRFRADSHINQVIRDVASKRTGQGVRLADSEAVLGKQSPHGLAGDKFLYEHVHLNFEGNYLVARALAEQIGQDLSDNGKRSWPTPENCAFRVGWNDSVRRAACMDILSRLNDAPFKDQASNRDLYQRLLAQIEHLQSANSPDSLRQEKVRTEAATKIAPDDWVLLESLANLQRQTGDAVGAAESLRKVTHLLPHNADALETFGLALESAKRYDEAAAAFQESASLRPESVVAMNSLAELYATAGRREDAALAFEQVLKAKPYWCPAHLGLGKVFEGMGKTNEANQQFQEALKNRINSPDSYNTLGRLAFTRGWYDAAVTNFADSLRLYPADADIHVNLGMALDKLKRRDEAKAHFEEAIRLRPGLAEAHFCLGTVLGRENNTAGAAAEFAEAVRLKPELIEARLNLGIALSNEHLNQQALDQFDEVLRRDARNQIALKYAEVLRGHPAATAQNP